MIVNSNGKYAVDLSPAFLCLLEDIEIFFTTEDTEFHRGFF